MEDSSSTHFGCLYLIGRSVCLACGSWSRSGAILNLLYVRLATSDGMRFQEAREENMDLNAVIWGALLDACSKSFAWRRASQLLVRGFVCFCVVHVRFCLYLCCTRVYVCII